MADERDGTHETSPDDYDPRWFVPPLIGTVLALITGPVVFLYLGLGLVGLEICSTSCGRSTAIWYFAVFWALAALVTAVGVWLGPHSRGWRGFRTGGVVAMETMAVMAIVLVFAT
ncbi:hypothetical protein [Streptomonospora wellingtoniae]|uniref:Uncharacterized protein n=1 Tax=Streptomonospora wellingtoniae TaxID=3075544 RepID=A0ABU2KZZ5_9ACTN|nr:hypothetical protein [Streptomonospora sp. DSM 45055]MDT0304732.1 hypothetical protein [Streptomonospora sp. DSM 45055]